MCKADQERTRQYVLIRSNGAMAALQTWCKAVGNLQTAGEPPSSGVTRRPNSGCSEKVSAALANSVTVKAGAAMRRASAASGPPPPDSVTAAIARLCPGVVSEGMDICRTLPANSVTKLASGPEA